MTSLKKLSSNELVQDYYNSRSEIGYALITKPVDEDHRKTLKATIRKNNLYMEAIAIELEQRGESERILV